jgi:hypothetical protein
MPTENSMIPLETLADELGVTRGNARKIALAMGAMPVLRQMRALGHHQRTLCWTREQVDQILAERRRQGFEIRA